MSFAVCTPVEIEVVVRELAAALRTNQPDNASGLSESARCAGGPFSVEPEVLFNIYAM